MSCDPIAFVTFHIDPAEESLSPDTPAHVAKGATEAAKNTKNSAEYREMIALMFQSVSVFHSTSRKVVLTDKNATFTNLPDDVEIYRYDIDTRDMMLSRTKAQLAFIEDHDFKSNVMFVDSDILINDNLDKALNWSEFDVALTIREDPLGMPINGGALFISNRRPRAAIEFIQAFYQKYVDKYLDQAQWWGDQRALVDILNADESPIVAGRRNVGDIVVDLIPCDTYNFSPNFKQAIDLYGAGARKRVVHFKGDRKQYMQPFWQHCILTRQLPPEAQFDALQHQLDSLQQDRQQLQKELAQAQKSHRTSQKQYRTLKKQHTALEQRYKNLVEHPFRSGLKALAKALKKSTQP